MFGFTDYPNSQSVGKDLARFLSEQKHNWGKKDQAPIGI